MLGLELCEGKAILEPSSNLKEREKSQQSIVDKKILIMRLEMQTYFAHFGTFEHTVDNVFRLLLPRRRHCRLGNQLAGCVFVPLAPSCIALGGKKRTDEINSVIVLS